MPDMTIVISSCKKYSDVLHVFEKLFMKYWADCPYDVVLSTDKKGDYSFKYSNVVDSSHNGNCAVPQEAA